MYGPAPTRRKKTNICRSRAGCVSCRKRRKKCDEQKPTCGSCLKLEKPCEQVSPAFEFRSVRPSETERPRPKPISTSFDIASLSREGSQSQSTPPCSATVLTISTASPCPTGSLDADDPRIIDFEDNDFNWHSNDINNHDFETSTEPYAPMDLSSQETQLDSKRTSDLCIRMPPTLVPRHDYSYLMKFYMNIWRHYCLPAMHISFNQIEALGGQSRLIRDTMATLSACRLSRTLPQRKITKISAPSSVCYRPEAGHESLSGELYGSAMRQISAWGHQELHSQPTVALTALVLFCYLESSMGNFKEFQVHSQAIEKLLISYSDQLMSDGAGLLAAWVEVKMQNWWRRAHFGVPDFYRRWSTPLLDPMFNNMSETSAYRRASVLWTLCESHRLSTAAIITSYEASLLKNTTSKETYLATSDQELMALMSDQSEKLDEWHASLQDHELPEIMEDLNLWYVNSVQKPKNAPIIFQSHGLAINFAYYVTARAMQCTGPLESLRSKSLDDTDDLYEEMEDWIQILLRIAAGINWNDCIRLNVYTIGFAGLLLACALRSRKLATGLWIQEWLEERLKEDALEEGNFPVFQILDAVQVINHERVNGRDVISLFQTVDDEGGSGKFGSYSSQHIQSFLVYARCNETGNLYSYQVTPGVSREQIERHIAVL
ncbi:hypothetical protein BT63DRAFT_10671 [Microthyrium microscopicum]|uniref:Zn(2)-C6 fungal-type domain-containing protein n=1 Tax=Microthyrium microscopicum TaxID=703497 RepID=A0A6A6UTR8_9PEZI|nr:hypothetical protein BT63DRAFT_10671 [Microthyrium microscopicum]